MNTILLVMTEARRLGIAARHGYVLMALQLFASAFELLGLVSFVPILQFLMARGDVARLAAENPHWRQMIGVCQDFGLTITLPLLMLATFLLFAVRQAITLARDLYDFVTRENEIARLRVQMICQYLNATADYQDRASSGGIVADINLNILRSVYHIFSRFGLVVQLILLGVYILGMVAIDAMMTGFLLLIVVLAGAIAAPHILKSRQVGRDFVSAGKRMSDYLLERIRLVRLVRLSRMESAEAAAFGTLSAIVRNIAVRSWALTTAVDKLLETIALVAGLIVIYVATTYFNVNVEIVGLFLAMLLRLMPVVRQLASAKQTIDAYRASYDSVIFRLSDSALNREPNTGTRSFDRLRDAVQFVGVGFAYAARPDARVLDDIDIKLRARQVTAIVGPSGAGKSTIVDLLPRLRSPREGRIEVDGVDIEDIDQQSLRRSIAYLSQTPLVFNVPLREHIAYGTPDATQADIERAARLAGIHDTIAALPEGYDTLAGEGGNRLSGGQRQRLDLARALLSGAPILILDEPAASLDGASAFQLNQVIERIRRETETTIVIISHHLPSICTADQIIVLRDGRVEAAGPHEQLIKVNGWYATTWRSQASDQTLASTPAA